MIDLRSDTLTKPPRDARGDGERRGGDEQKREDPTVIELERRGAEFLGQEEAVFLPTATMANQIALNILGRPGMHSSSRGRLTSCCRSWVGRLRTRAC